MAMLRPLEGAFHNGPRCADACFNPLTGARVEFLSVAGDQFGFVIEQVALTGSSVHEELENAPGFRGKWRRGCGPCLALHQPGQRNSSEAGAEAAKKIAARESVVHGSVKMKEFAAVEQHLR